jgi:hypothetical protein
LNYRMSVISSWAFCPSGCDSDSESESLTTLPFLAISDPSSVAISSPLGSHVGTSMGPTFSTTHPGRSTIQDTTKCGNVETQNQQWRNTRNGRAQLFDHSRALLEVVNGCEQALHVAQQHYAGCSNNNKQSARTCYRQVFGV